MLLHDILILLYEIGDAVPPEDMVPQGKGIDLPPHPHPEQDKWALWQIIGGIITALITAAGGVAIAWLGLRSVQKKRAQN